MNRQQFSEFVKNPGMTNSHSLKMLEDLVRSYPYCQSGQFLYTYNLFREENLQYPLQLKKAAAYASDRKMLKELIDSAKIKIPLSKPESREEVYHEKFGPIPQGELATFQASPKDSNQDAVLPSDINTESTEDVGSGQLAFQASHDRMTHEELLAIVRKRLAEIKADKNQVNSAPKSPQHPESSLQHPSSDDNVHISPRTKEALIDKFIIEEPKISKPKTAFFNPSDSAVRSNFDDEEIVSETLAKLYAAQGNIPKAVHIYQKLSLLNQEKSRYFAAQIENLKS